MLVFSVTGIQLRAQEATLADRIAALPHVKDVQGIVHPDSATVVVTEGYGAQYAFVPSYRDEISTIFNTNNIVVEHRYFLESTPYPGEAPEDVNWDYMNAPNAAADIHEVVTALKDILDGKWISTGISKGGQNTMIYRTYYPDDVDFSVPYVGPLCRALHDGRHEPFIETYVGSPADREAVKNFQSELLLRKERLQCQQLQVQRPDRRGLRLRSTGVLVRFLAVGLSRGADTREGCLRQGSVRLHDGHLLPRSPEYFVTWSTTSPFFVQAAKELGYYGYDMKPFKEYRKYFSIKNTKNYLQKLMLPQGVNTKNYLQKLMLPQGVDLEFSDYLYNKISAFLLSTDARMLFIYGQFDPWSAVMPADPHKDNIKFFVQPGGSHRARIATFDEATQKEIKSILSQWLYE